MKSFDSIKNIQLDVQMRCKTEKCDDAPKIGRCKTTLATKQKT